MVRSLFVVTLVGVLLLAGCSASPDYWLPPSSPQVMQSKLALLIQTPAPLIAPPDSVEEPADQPIELLETVPSPTPDLFGTPASDAQPYPVDNQPPILYEAQAADTLPVVAVRFGVQPEEITSPDPIPPSVYLKPGQLLVIPRRLQETTSPVHLLPDSEVVYSPSAADFNPADYAAQAGGGLQTHQQWLQTTGLISGAEVVSRVALENSINPRLLLALLEYQTGYVFAGGNDRSLRDDPLGLNDPTKKGLYNQLVWAVNHLSNGYYAYREGRLTEIRFPDGSTARLAPDLNAGTVALQYFFAQLYQGQDWLNALDPSNGFPALYARMFGDPWERAQRVEPLFPAGLTQPAFILPFTREWVWSYTGGPHGAWEREGAYAALDFAPGSTEAGCVRSPAWTLASAAGLVTRSEDGLVAIDLDGDGREQTGWVLTYLHLAEEGRVKAGTWVDVGDMLGHPSCEGGVSTGTHVHIARKYNGEWMPADGPVPFNLGGWVAYASDAAYLGTLVRDGKTITACTCANAASFISRGPEDP
jgi:murein DD-endopeptidase MepM/ murein hydrolase activator NlpD